MIKNRHKEIIRLLMTKPFMRIEELCHELDASPATIRRDLHELEKEGSLLRINGGAIYNEPKEKTDVKADPYAEEKKKIAESAVSFVKDGDTLFMDAGSTNLHIADKLLDLTNITIVTNSLEIAYKFIKRRDLTVIVCGGTLGEVNPGSVVGEIAEKMISMFRANIFFMGASGVDIRQGITDPHLSPARIKAKMIENATKVFLVADHSKFGVISTAYVCPIEKLSHIITGQAAPQEDILYLMNRNIKVTLV